MTATAAVIISRTEARNLGLKRYFTGRPCRKGHIAERFVFTANCFQCAEELRWGRKGVDPASARATALERNSKSARLPVPQDAPDGAKYIPLTRGYFALVDVYDYDSLSRFNWYVLISDKMKYAFRSGQKRLGESGEIGMHQQILRLTDGRLPDHRNGNGLDNRRSNLRPATHAQNLCNRGKPETNSSGFKGVCRVRGKEKWQASIKTGQSCKFLGHFDTAEEAARAYDSAALRYHGEFAHINFPELVGR
jgi:hypothetical protein